MFLRAFVTMAVFCICSLSFAQLKNTACFTLKKDSCETKYIIDSTGIYFTSVSYGRSSAVAFGRYTTSADKLFFKPLSFDSLPPFAAIKESEAKSDTVAKITFLARYNKIIPVSGFAVDAIDTSGKHYKRFFLNAEGAIFINPRRFTFVRINYLDHFYARWILVPVKAANITVELSLPKEFFRDHHPHIDMDPAYTLIIKDGGLYTSAGKVAAFADK